jgi:hypothetical protein
MDWGSRIQKNLIPCPESVFKVKKALHQGSRVRNTAKWKKYFTILTIFKSVLLVLRSEDPVNFDNVLVVQLQRLQNTVQLCQVALSDRQSCNL